MRVQNINLSQQRSRYNKRSAAQTNVVAYNNSEFQQSFKGLNFKFLGRLFNPRNEKAIVSAEKVASSSVFQSDEFFLSKLDELGLKKHDGFLVFTPDGKLIHSQKPGDYDITDETNKKITNNVILASNNSSMSLGFVGMFFEEGVRKIFHYSRGAEEYSVVKLPPKTESLLKKARAVHRQIHDKVQDEIRDVGCMMAMQSGRMAMVNGSDIGPHLEQKYMGKFLSELWADYKIFDSSLKPIQRTFIPAESPFVTIASSD